MTELSAVHRTLLPASPPFDLACSLRALAGFAPCAGDQFVAEGRVRKALAHPTDPSDAVVVEVGPGRDDATVSLTVHAHAPLASDEVARVGLAVERWLGLGDDRAAFLSIARGDPAMAGVLSVAEGLHQVRFASLAEATAYFTLTQRSTQWFAAARKRRLTAELGPCGRLDGVDYRAFPTMSTLADLTVEDLVPYGGSRKRAERLHEVIAGVATLDEAWLRTAPYPEARAALLAVRGIGTFTAHALLLRALGRPDDAPLEMEQFTQLATRLYGAPAPSPAEIRERYGPWVGWWAYLARTALPWLRPPTPASRKPRHRLRARPEREHAGPEQTGLGRAEPEQAGLSRVESGQIRPRQSGHAGVAGRSAAQSELDSSQRSRVRTPQPVAPLTSSASFPSDQADDDMSMCAQRSRSGPVNSRRYSAAITEPAPMSVELTRSATSLPSAST
jgi:DNA-3-methyladenine glycosylase II